jgi:hypothetical protein
MSNYCVCALALVLSIPLGCSLEAGSPQTEAESEPAALQVLPIGMCQIAPKDGDCVAGMTSTCSSSAMSVPYWQIDKPGCYHQWLVGWQSQQISVSPQWHAENSFTHDECLSAHIDASGYVENGGTWSFFGTKKHGVWNSNGTCGTEFDSGYAAMLLPEGQKHRTAIAGYHYHCVGLVCAKIFDQVEAGALPWKPPTPN